MSTEQIFSAVLSSPQSDALVEVVSRGAGGSSDQPDPTNQLSAVRKATLRRGTFDWLFRSSAGQADRSSGRRTAGWRADVSNVL